MNPPTTSSACRAPDDQAWRESLADGAPGLMLWHVNRAATAGWEPVDRLAVAMTNGPVHAHPDLSSLYRGAPAVAYALHTANRPGYRTVLSTLDRAIDVVITHRLSAAHRRIDAGQLPEASEYDLISGLTGLGAYLLHRHGDHPLLRDVLGYLVRLTEPLPGAGVPAPGWWAAGSPDRRPFSRWDGGHAGFGLAHGIAGPLALLSIALRRGIAVDGHAGALRVILTWLDRWQHGCGRTASWPEVLDRHELHAGTTDRHGPYRPSWCYGTPGIARALQLAGHALGDGDTIDHAGQAMLGCLTDRRQLAQFTDAGLCHGWAGLVHTAHRAATDTATDAVSAELTAAAEAARRRLRVHLPDRGQQRHAGLLEGTAGIALVDDAGSQPPGARWDMCLLIG